MPGTELLSIALLLFACIAIQAITLTAVQRRLRVMEPWIRRHDSFAAELLLTYVVILVVVLMHVMQACIWAVFYASIVGVEPLRDAFYHSILSLTTMDDSSGVLPERWRLLGAAEGLTGWIVFSWSTAWVFLFLTTFRVAGQVQAAHGLTPGSRSANCDAGNAGAGQEPAARLRKANNQ